MDPGEQFARSIGHWAVPGRCSVPGCDHPRVFPCHGLCPVHARAVWDFGEWVRYGTFDSDRLALDHGSRRVGPDSAR